jgi:hypothetical protein
VKVAAAVKAVALDPVDMMNWQSEVWMTCTQNGLQ